MEQNQFKCIGDCLNCYPVQRQYCAAQKAYDNQRLLLDLTKKVEAIESKMASIQDDEARVFNPAIVPDVSPSGQNTAQEGSGAVK